MSPTNFRHRRPNNLITTNEEPKNYKSYTQVMWCALSHQRERLGQKLKSRDKLIYVPTKYARRMVGYFAETDDSFDFLKNP